MAGGLGICAVVICAWTVANGYPVKSFEFQSNQLSNKKYEQKEIMFSPESSIRLNRIVGPRAGQFHPETEWTYHIVDDADGRSKRQKRQVRKPTSVQGKGTSPDSGAVRGKGPDKPRQSVQNKPKRLPERQNEGIFKQSIRDILILGTKKDTDKNATQRKNGKPSGSGGKTPRRSNKGSFSIVPAKPKPRRFPLRQGWRSRLRARTRARARSQKPKPKKITRKTVRRGFVIID